MVQRQILNSLKCQPIRDTECPDVQDDALIAGAKLKGNIQSRNVRTAQYTVAKLVINLEFQWHLLSVAGFCLSSIHQFFPAYLILNFLLLLVLFFCLHRYVRPVYVICQNSDGAFDAPEGEENSVESALARIATNARLLQTFTAENLYRHGLGRKTFRLEETEDGGVKVNIFKSKLDLNEALKMSGDELYGVFEKGMQVWIFVLNRRCLKVPSWSANATSILFQEGGKPCFLQLYLTWKGMKNAEEWYRFLVLFNRSTKKYYFYNQKYNSNTLFPRLSTSLSKSLLLDLEFGRSALSRLRPPPTWTNRQKLPGKK